MSNTASPIVEGPALARALPSTTVPQFIREALRRRPDALAMIDAPAGAPSPARRWTSRSVARPRDWLRKGSSPATRC